MRRDAQASRPLIGFGFWYSFYEPEFPAPSQFVDAEWNPVQRSQVLSYLRQGRELNHWMGYSWCRFRCGAADSSMGAIDLTDGTYCWPEGLAHYVEQHAVRLPARIVEHILAQQTFPVEAAGSVAEFTPVDKSWWQAQRGWRPPASCSPFWFTSRHEAQDFLRRIDRSPFNFGKDPDSVKLARARLVEALRSEIQ